LKNKLDGRQVYWQSEVDGFCKVFFDPASKANDQGRLYAFVTPAVDRYKALTEEEQDEFKRQLTQWLRLYSFLSQIVPFQDVALEKLFVYGKHLILKLPKQDISERLKLNDEVALEYYRLQKIADNEAIVMEALGEYGLQGSSETGMKRDKEEKAPLSSIISVLNDRFSADFTEADKLFFDQIEQELVDDQKLIHQAQNNTMDNFRYGFHDAFIDKLIDRMEQNQEISSRILTDKQFGRTVIDLILENVYRRINR